MRADALHLQAASTSERPIVLLHGTTSGPRGRRAARDDIENASLEVALLVVDLGGGVVAHKIGGQWFMRLPRR